MSNVISGIEESNDGTCRIEHPSIISMLLIFASTTAMLIAPSIPNSTLAIASFSTFLVAAILSKMQLVRQLFFVALNRSAILRFSDREPYGDPWYFL
jgi:uncharacterized membrane protein